MKFSNYPDTVSQPSTPSGSDRAQKSDSLSVEETKKDPEKYYMATSPVSIMPLLQTDLICGGTEGKEN